MIIVKIDTGLVKCESKPFLTEEAAEAWVVNMMNAVGLIDRNGIELEECDAPRAGDTVEADESAEGEVEIAPSKVIKFDGAEPEGDITA